MSNANPFSFKYLNSILIKVPIQQAETLWLANVILLDWLFHN
jgi:hypothetical protein